MAGTRFNYPRGMQGWANLSDWLQSKMAYNKCSKWWPLALQMHPACCSNWTVTLVRQGLSRNAVLLENESVKHWNDVLFFSRAVCHTLLGNSVISFRAEYPLADKYSNFEADLHWRTSLTFTNTAKTHHFQSFTTICTQNLQNKVSKLRFSKSVKSLLLTWHQDFFWD